MKLLTKELAKKLPAIYSTEKLPESEKMAIVKFFGGSSFSFYAIEANAIIPEFDSDGKECGVTQVSLAKATIQGIKHKDVEFFGYVSGVQEPELCYMMLSQLEGMRFPPFGFPTERDKFYSPESLMAIKQRGY